MFFFGIKNAMLEKKCFRFKKQFKRIFFYYTFRNIEVQNSRKIREKK